MGRLIGAAKDDYIQSIIGATEKRRESGAGVALVTDIGDLESVRLGGGGSLTGLSYPLRFKFGAGQPRLVNFHAVDAISQM